MKITKIQLPLEGKSIQFVDSLTNRNNLHQFTIAPYFPCKSPTLVWATKCHTLTMEKEDKVIGNSTIEKDSIKKHFFFQRCPRNRVLFIISKGQRLKSRSCKLPSSRVPNLGNFLATFKFNQFGIEGFINYQNRKMPENRYFRLFPT